MPAIELDHNLLKIKSIDPLNVYFYSIYFQ